MNFIALKILLGERTKYAGLLFGIAFTSFLVTFAGFCFGGKMNRSFALIAENPRADVWVMDPAVVAVDRQINLLTSAPDRGDLPIFVGQQMDVFIDAPEPIQNGNEHNPVKP